MPDPVHPNLAIMQRLDIKNLDACADCFADDFVWHYFNSNWPDVDGDYRGVPGLKDFFSKLQQNSKGTFQVNPIDARAVGEELVVTQVCNRLELPAREGGSFEFDAVMIWRIVNGKIAEAWDIPAVNTVRAYDTTRGWK